MSSIISDYGNGGFFIPGISFRDIKDILFPEDLIREGKKERVLEIISEHESKLSTVFEKVNVVNNELKRVNSLFNNIVLSEAAIDKNFKECNRLLKKAKNVKIEKNDRDLSDSDVKNLSSCFPFPRFTNTVLGYLIAKGAMYLYREYVKSKGNAEFEYTDKLKEILNKKTSKFQIQCDKIYDEILILRETAEKLNDQLEQLTRQLICFIKQFEVEDTIDISESKDYFNYIHTHEEVLKELNKQYDENTKEYKKLAIKYSEIIILNSKVHKNCKNYAYFLNKTENLLNHLDEEFEKETELDSVDNAFLCVATGLQILRQFFLTSFPVRLSDKEVAKKVKGNKKEKSDRDHDLYNPSLEQIILNPVPFDAVHGADGKLKGGNHRYVTLGHDPILGLIFGTANIATSTITLHDFKSYHVKTNEKKVDSFSAPADTFEIFQECYYKMQDIEGMKKLVISLNKEIIHLKSDLTSTLSLPIPFSQVISPKLASKLAQCGIDSANLATVGKQIAYAQLINTFISIMHQLLFLGDYNSRYFQLYTVKTKKIIMISGALSSLVNLTYVFGTNDFRRLDIGGIGLAIKNFITMKSEIDDLKTKYIFETYLKELEKTSEEIDEQTIEKESKEIYDKIIIKVFDITDEELKKYNSSFKDIPVLNSYALSGTNFNFFGIFNIFDIFD